MDDLQYGERTAERAKVLYEEGVGAFRQGDQERARLLSDESLSISRELGDKAGIATALIGLSRVALRDGDYPQVRALCDESNALAQELGDREGMVMPLHMLAEVTRLEGDYDRAEELYNQSLALNEELGDRGMVGVEMHNKGYVALHKNNLQESRELFTGSLKIDQEFGSETGVAFCIAGLAAVAGAEGDFTKATRLFGAAEAQFDRLGIILDPADKPEFDRNLEIARGGLSSAGDVSFEAERAAGRDLTLEQAVAYALGEK